MRNSLFILIIFASTLASANSDNNCDICTGEDDPLKKLICFYYHSKDKVTSKSESTIILSCLNKHWENRGAGGGPLISDAFLFQAEKYPTNFFSEMSKEHKKYSEWLSKLGNYSFVWYKTSPSPLEQRRKRIISTLKSNNINNANHEKMQIELINTLVRIRPRTVD